MAQWRQCDELLAWWPKVTRTRCTPYKAPPQAHLMMIHFPYLQILVLAHLLTFGCKSRSQVGLIRGIIELFNPWKLVDKTVVAPRNLPCSLDWLIKKWWQIKEGHEKHRLVEIQSSGGMIKGMHTWVVHMHLEHGHWNMKKKQRRGHYTHFLNLLLHHPSVCHFFRSKISQVFPWISWLPYLIWS